jgi:hypothetical protein
LLSFSSERSISERERFFGEKGELFRLKGIAFLVCVCVCVRERERERERERPGRETREREISNFFLLLQLVELGLQFFCFYFS